MNTVTKKMFRLLLAFAITVGGLALTGSHASAAPVSINMCALPGNLALPGAVTVPIWGFGIPTTPGDCSTATASLPGPVFFPLRLVALLYADFFRAVPGLLIIVLLAELPGLRAVQRADLGQISKSQSF